MSSLTVKASDFKALLSAATRFPIVGGLAGSEMLTLTTSKGSMFASSLGVVLSKSKCPVEGEIPGIAVDERLLSSFAAVCDDSQVITITVDKEICLHGKHDVTAPLAPPANHRMTPIKELKNAVRLDIAADIAKRISYLSALAFSDSSRGELCCVMLLGDQAMAASQKAVGIFACVSGVTRTALPLPIARVVKAGDVVYVSPTETILKSGIGTYAIPSQLQAQQNFPSAAIESMRKSQVSLAFSCAGPLFAAAVADAHKCLSSLSGLEIVLLFRVTDNVLTITGENGGAKFTTSLPVKAGKYTGEFRLPLNELLGVIAFPAKQLQIAIGEKGEVTLTLDDGWSLFPAFIPTKAKGKKK